MALVRSGALVSVFTLAAFYPYLPGAYDSMAVPLSLVAQAVTLACLPLVPLGVWGLAVARPNKRRGLAVTSWTWAVGAIASLVAWASGGLVFGVVTAALGAFALVRFARGLSAFAVAVIPLLAFLLQWQLAEPLTNWSRARAIASSTALIADIEAYHARQGRYPTSMHAVWPDYKTTVVGIEKFHYAANDDAYDLSFEQPLPIVRAFGTREFVVFHPRGRHMMLSHAAWHLTRSPETLAGRQGWYAVRDLPQRGWKSFHFD